MVDYLFDRKLRFLMMDAIERIEVALRSQIAYHHTAGQSPFAYAQQTYFPHWKGYIQSLERVRIQRDKHGNIKQSGVISLTTSSINTAISMIICLSGWQSE